MALSVTTTTGTIAPNNSQDFEVPVGSTLTVTFPPNSQATVTENPLFVGQTTTAGKLDQRITRVDGIPQTLTCGPYPTGANVTVSVSVRSSATASWSQDHVGVVTATRDPATGLTTLQAGDRSVEGGDVALVSPRNSGITVVAMKYNHWANPSASLALGGAVSTASAEGGTFEPWDAWPWRCLQPYPERLPLAARQYRARPLWTWNDDQTINTLMNGWSAVRATLSRVSQAMRVTPTAADPQVYSPNYLSLPGDLYRTVEIKISRSSGSSWDGVLYWITDDDTAFNAGKSVAIAQPASWTGEQTITLDMSGVAAWNAGMIRQLRLDLGSDASTVFDLNSIEIRGNASAKMYERITALPLNEQWAVDWELRTAYENGVDVFSVCHFKQDVNLPGKHSWYFDRLIASTAEPNMKFCIIGIYQPPYDSVFTSQSNLEKVANDYAAIIQAAGDRYWKIDGRPVIQCFSMLAVMDTMIGANFPITYSGGTSGSNRRFALQQWVSRMRNRLTAVLGVNPYIVCQHNGSEPFWFANHPASGYIGTLQNANFDAVTSYIHRTASYNHVIGPNGGTAEPWPPAASADESEKAVRSYATLVECRDRNQDFIYEQSGLAKPYWPHVTVGWARYPWAERDQVTPNPEDLNWPGYQQLRANFTKARDYIDRYPDKTQRIVTIYAWDEYGEGGVLAPTKGQGYTALQAMREGLRIG